VTGASPSRRQFLAFAGAVAVATACSDAVPSSALAATSSGCSGDACSTGTAWILDPAWGYARGPHAKTRLVSGASRAAAANRIARTEADALNMNLHQCSWAPAIPTSVCATQFDAAFGKYARDWDSPWNDTTVPLLDKRWLPADFDLTVCPVSTDPSQPRSSPITAGAHATPPATADAKATADALAFTGGGTRRLLFAGVGAVLVGTLLRRLEGSSSTVAARQRVTDRDGE
jgi:hypothetical protein